jgi:hypothetical protein
MLGKLSLPAALLAGALLWTGCGRNVPDPKGGFAGIQKQFEDAKVCEERQQFEGARDLYLNATRAAEGLLRSLVPGDPLLAEVETVRNGAATGAARMKEALRKQGVAFSGPPTSSGSSPFATKTLPLPVLAYVPAATEKPPETTPPGTDPTKTTPPPATDPTKTTTPGAETPPTATDPAKTTTPPPPPPAEVEKKAVRITKAVFKADRIIIIYWTWTNLTDKQQPLGAIVGKVLSTTNARLATLRFSVLGDKFALNPDNPTNSQGKEARPDSFTLGIGDSREIVTVGEIEPDKDKRIPDVGSVSIELRLQDGDASDKTTAVVKEP